MYRRGAVAIFFLLALAACGDGGRRGRDAAVPDSGDGGLPVDADTCDDFDDDGFGDGCAAGPDCAPDDGDVHPGADDICNGIDDDCSGAADEGCVCEDGEARACGPDVGACIAGEQRCVRGAWGECVGAIGPIDDSCDGELDEDCDGAVDEGCGCTNGTTQRCGSDLGACMMGLEACVDGAWGECAGEVGPSAEVCAGMVDEDCDGLIDCADADCMGMTCGTSAPATHCVDGVTLRSYASVGSCSDGACVHASTDTACPERCDGGACVTCTPDPWTLSTVDSDGDTGRRPVLAVDGAGGVHVAYGDQTNIHLRYAYRSPTGVWTTTTAHAGGSSEARIALDSAGGVHVTGHHFMNAGTLYAYRSPAGAWTRSMAGTEAGTFPAITVDAAGLLHMTYSRAFELKYTQATTAGGWSTSAIPRPGGVGGTHTEPRLDASGGSHVVYYDQSNGDLRYTHRPSGGTWTDVLVDGTGNVGFLPWLVIDDSGELHVSYLDRTNGHLRYAHRDLAGAWTTTRVDRRGMFVSRHGVAVDAYGGVHFAYYDADSEGLRYALLRPSGTWTYRTLDSAGTTGLNPSIGVDASGRVYIAYWSATTEDLGFATGVECW